jgi:CubicO group peptidase (beta-lactamase class C family)
MREELERILGDAVTRGDVLGAAGAVVTPAGVVEGAAGERSPGVAMTPETLVYIASMTKALTAAGAMKLVEQGELDLDSPCGDLVPYLRRARVLEGFDGGGEAILRAPARPITLRHLLTHTSGFGYEFTDAVLARYVRARELPELTDGRRVAYEYPLLFDPGERWCYGIGIDWAGQVVEAAAGARLDEYVKAAILDPLGMPDTRFCRDAEQRDRTASMQFRTADGLVPAPFEIAEEPEMLSGGGGLYSTVGDYLRFVRMILGGGELDGVRVLDAETVRTMSENHIGDLDAATWQSANPAVSNDVDFFPGMRQEWGLSFLVNTEQTPEGRAAGSLAWAGIANTYFWIDTQNQVGGVFATQILPFFDDRCLKTFRAVEHAAYRSL